MLGYIVLPLYPLVRLFVHPSVRLFVRSFVSLSIRLSVRKLYVKGLRLIFVNCSYLCNHLSDSFNWVQVIFIALLLKSTILALSQAPRWGHMSIIRTSAFPYV